MLSHVSQPFRSCCFYLLIAITAMLAGAQELKQPDDLAARLRRLPVSIGENRTITVQPGESWVDIGIREHVGYEHLRRANPRGFSSGSILIPGRHQVSGLVKDGIVINLPELMDFRFADELPVAWYPISIGRVAGWHTPVGELRVVNRRKNPIWYQPSWAGGGRVPAGRNNPLGDRWIGLSAPGYGLHGTNQQTSIGRTVSHGCMRHFPAHIRELFDSVWVGMPVIIDYQTVTVGQQDGIVYLAIFPDVYGHGTNAAAKVRARLASFGLDGLFTGSELAAVIAQADGVARPILGSATPVLLNGARLNTPVGPTKHDGQSYLPLRAVTDALGATVAWDAAARSVLITRGGSQVAFPVDGAKSFNALGALFVPVRPLVDALGGSVQFDVKQGVVLFIPQAAGPVIENTPVAQ